MTRDEFLQKMFEKGKITQAQVGGIKAKDEAIALYAKDGYKMTKDQIKAVLDKLLS
ncbi:MAG: hypothetical protein WC749_02430 [Dehalococcoidia bacterium]